MHRLAHRAKRYFSSFLLATSIFAGGLFAPPGTHAQTEKTAPKFSDVSSVFNKASDTTQIAAKDSIPYTYMSQNPDSVPTDAKRLWDNMQILKNSETIIGPALAKFSEEEKILYRYDDYLPGAFGIWENKKNLVHISKFIRAKGIVYKMPKPVHLVVQAHETIHALQNKNGLRPSTLDRPINEVQLLLLSYEAAGDVGEHLLAIELAEDGYTLPLENLSIINKERVDEIIAVWDSLKAAGVPYAQALEETGRAAFYQLFQCQKWLDAYNNRLLLDYLKLADLKKDWPKDETVGLQAIQQTGYISPEFNFTANLDSMPSNLFGSNDYLRWSFACAELWRIKLTCGAESPTYKEAYRELKEVEKNPYVDVDMKKVLDLCIKLKERSMPLSHIRTFHKKQEIENAKPKGP